MASIEDLPVELIAQMFFFTCQASYAENGRYIDLLRSLLSIGAISSHWRGITLSTPALWKYVDMPRTDWDRPLDSVLSRVQAHFERSGTASLDLSIYFRPKQFPETNRLLWEMISPELQRSRSILMKGLTRELADSIFPFEAPLSNLETLQVFSAAQPRLSEPLTVGEGIAPKLVHLLLSEIRLTHIPIAPITRLTLMHRETMSWSYVLASLEPFPHLEHVILRFGWQDDNPSVQPLTLPNVKSLFVSDSRLSRYLSVPKLEHLGCWLYEGTVDLASLPTLQRLSVQYPARSTLESWESSPSLADLHTLDLTMCWAVDSLLNLLHSRSEGATLSTFPRLNKLRIHRCSFPSRSDVHFRQRLLQVLEIRPQLFIEIDGNSLPTLTPVEWLKLGDESAGRLSRLDPDTLVDFL